MTMGVFVQLNETSRCAATNPIGYVIQENGCWDWVGPLAGSGVGYGYWSRNGKTVRASRALFEIAKGPIPRGLQLDHLCRNTHCVNPDHLEPVTNRENSLRGIGITAQNAKKQTCSRGHDRWYVSTREDGRTRRRCIECHTILQRNKRAEKRRSA